MNVIMYANDIQSQARGQLGLHLIQFSLHFAD